MEKSVEASKEGDQETGGDGGKDKSPLLKLPLPGGHQPRKEKDTERHKFRKQINKIAE